MECVHLGNSEINVDINDNNFHSTLRRVLQVWYNLDIEKFPEILSLIGVESGIYRIDEKVISKDVVSFYISSEQKKYIIHLYYRYMNTPYPTWVLTDMNRQLKKSFFVGMKGEVEEISTMDFSGRGVVH